MLSASSMSAALYSAWERRLVNHTADMVVPLEARPIVRSLPLSRVVALLTRPDSMLGEHATTTRDFILYRSLNEAVGDVARRFGPDTKSWQYGAATNHHVRIAHPLDGVLVDSLRARVSPGPLARGGYANTLNATGNSDNQTAGASLRVVMDVADWDRAMATNTPGQSGDPRSAHYADLFPLWARGDYVPLPYSPAAVARRAESIQLLRP